MLQAPQLTIFRLARWLVVRLPLALSYRVAAGLGDLAWLFNRGVRANFEHNQRRALGPGASEREVALSARAAIRTLSAIYVDELRFPSLSADEVRRLIHFRGLERIEAAREAGTGVILVSGHYGAPNIVGQGLAVAGFPTTVVVEHIQPESLFDFFSALRRTHGLRLLPVDAPMRPLLRTLRKERGIAALVCDRDINGNGIPIRFFGEETTIPTGPAQVALATGAPILVGHCRRRPDHQYEGRIEPLRLPPLPAERDAAVRLITERIVAALEEAIRAEPSQWVMSVPLWKNGP